MSSKDIYCYRVMKAYSLVVNFDGDIQRVNVPSPVKEETFKHWKDRVFGKGVANLTVYKPTTPAPQTKMKNLQSDGGVGHLDRVFRALEREKRSEKVAAVDSAVAGAEKRFSTIPKDMLEDILIDPDVPLDPAVEEFLRRFANQDGADVDLETFLRAMMQTYNEAARTLRAHQRSVRASPK